MIILNDDEPRGLGYVELDHRATHAPMPPGRRHFEADTFTCSHCEAVVIVLPIRKQRPHYRCRGCNHHICDNCAAKRYAGAPCRTYKQFIDEHREKIERQIISGSIILP